MINATAERTDINKLSTSIDSFVELKHKLNENIEQYNQCEKFYTKTINKFVEEYTIDYKPIVSGYDQLSYTMKIPSESISDSYNTCRQNSIKEFFKDYNIGYNEQKFFNYYAGLLIDSIKFFTKTYNEIINLKENKKLSLRETLQKIGEDGKLMKKFMLSCDWIQKITCSTNLCVMYVFRLFTMEKLANEHIYILIRYVTQKGDSAINTEFIRCIADHIVTKECDTIQKIIEMENYEEICKLITNKQYHKVRNM